MLFVFPSDCRWVLSVQWWISGYSLPTQTGGLPGANSKGGCEHLESAARVQRQQPGSRGSSLSGLDKVAWWRGEGLFLSAYLRRLLREFEFSWGIIWSEPPSAPGYEWSEQEVRRSWACWDLGFGFWGLTMVMIPARNFPHLTPKDRKFSPRDGAWPMVLSVFYCSL